MSTQSSFQDNFTTIYRDRAYRYSTIVRHNGIVIAFAMDQQRKIYYSVLNLNQGSGDASGTATKVRDRDNWLQEPQELYFTNEITQVGFGGLDLTTLPIVNQKGEIVTNPATVRPEEIDRYRSSTAILTADAPFQVVSDGRFLCVFRQAIASDDANAVFKRSGDQVVLDSQGQPVPLVDRTLLLDRFMLIGTTLQPKMEVRYQRSRNKDFPQSVKDSLSAIDMESKPFYEPTQEITFIDHLSQGRFTVLLLPTKIPEMKRWQIFAYDSQQDSIASWSIPQSEDGLFDLYDPDQQAIDGATPPSIEQLLETDPLKSFRWDFRASNRTLESGFSAILYFQQETAATGYDNLEKPMKTSARVLLTMATSDSSDPQSRVTALDFAVSIDGKLVQVPETLDLQTIAATQPGEIPIPTALQQIKDLDQAIPQTQAEIDRLQLMVDPALRSQLEHKQTRLSRLQEVLNSPTLFDPAKNPSVIVTLTGAINSTAGLMQELQADVRLLQERSIPVHLNPTQQLALVQSFTSRVSIAAVPTLVRQLQPIVQALNTQLAAQLRLLSDAKLPNQLAAAQVKLADQIAERDRLRAILRHDVRVPMLPIVTDDNGLSVLGAVLEFAKTIDTPQLFDSANGHGMLYFRGANHEFLSAHYSTLSHRAIAAPEKVLMPHWVGLPPGNALQFDGKDNYVGVAKEGAALAAAQDLTLEAWVKPSDQLTGSARILHQVSATSRYTLGIEQLPLFPLKFNGGDGLQVAFPSQLKDNPSFTVSFWVKFQAATQRQAILWFGQPGINTAAHWLIGSDRRVQFGFWDGAQHQFSLADYENQWVFVTTVYSAAAKTLTTYLNGDRKETLSDLPSVLLGTTTFQIGSAALKGESGLQGELDHVQVWSQARSQAEIELDMYRRPQGNEAGLLAYWQFENRDLRNRVGNTAPQRTVGNPQASPSTFSSNFYATVGTQTVRAKTLLPSATWNHLAAIYNQSYALTFNGSTDVVDCGSDITLNINRDLALEVFLQVNTLGERRGILSKGKFNDGTAQDVPYALYVNRDGKLVFAFEDGDRKYQEFQSNASLTRGQFHRIAIVRKHVVEQPPASTTNPETIDPNNIQPTQSAIITFYIDRQPVGTATYDGGSVGSGNQSLEIGRAYLSNGTIAPFVGTISEVRIWNTAISNDLIGRDLKGQERGLVSWWRMEENEGTTTFDAKSNNHGKLKGVTWVKNPDPQGSSLTLYHNGVIVPAQPMLTGPRSGDTDQFTLGAALVAGKPQERFRGDLEEVRIWKVPRTSEQLQDNLFRRLLDDQESLIACYTFDAEALDQLLDHSFNGHHLPLGQAPHRPTFVVSTAPVSDDVPQVRNALAGIDTTFNDVIHSQPNVQEYGDMQYDGDGNLIGILKRCHTFIKEGQWHLLTGYKVGNLVAEWVGQVQFDPQLIGYIEGAPPIPGENLTRQEDYSQATSVEIVQADRTVHTYSVSKDQGFDMSVEAQLGVGLKLSTAAGIGVVQDIADANVILGVKTTFEHSLGWLEDASVGSGKQTTKVSRLDLQGHWNGERFVPQNVGFALVQSETADVFALRLKHNHALVSYQMRPNPDIPKDFNILTFPINSLYTKQGSLDGRLGLDADPSSGDASYFKPIEAFALKSRIQRQEEELKSFFAQFDAGAIGRRQNATHFSQGDLAAGRALEKLPRLEKRNLVNTYVWTANGGLFTESQETLDVMQEQVGGSFSFTGKAGITAQADISILGAAAEFSMEAMFGGHLNLTVTKSQDSETSFGLNVSLEGVERDIHQRDRQGRVVLDTQDPLNPVPQGQPGKVDAYRFMSFYLQPDVQHFDDFVNKVIDPVWLNQSNNPNAIALRQAIQAQQNASDRDKSIPWRVLHRVTFISRVLPDVDSPQATPMEKALIKANLRSGWQLARRLAPFIQGKVGADVNLAIQEAIALHLPELKPHTPEVIAYMRDYFSIPETA
ncbi:laminin G domain-containing protein [Nodosilinea sp. LEGE 07298]|uniref:LamG domain-containing protein n=1 Tax=Nodosilinea sp. LEGE 07298 TaxID=2777970 RepID=UPI001882AAD1|nr:LamG domain-containing protein [Nodosilinea sp. LEGE 07298]MBE9112795.1 laminin G domain-containing protein [Nodosilinea sp. LEGE 07298]